MCDKRIEATKDMITVFNFIQQLFKTKLPNDFTLNQFHTLLLLTQTKGLNQQELGGKLFLKKSSISGIVEKLIKKKCIRSSKDKSDKRINRLFLTTKGENTFYSLQNKIITSQNEFETISFNKAINRIHKFKHLVK